jgi:hypothetical protein
MTKTDIRSEERIRSDSKAQVARVFGVANKIRSDILLTAASILLIPLLVALLESRGVRLPRGVGPGGGVVVGAGLLLLFGFSSSFRIRVDECGIAHRAPFSRWDVWPWEAFVSGQITHGAGTFTFNWIDRPKGPKQIVLDFLAEGDRNHVMDAVLAHWVPPPLPQIPESLGLRFGLLRKTVIECDDREIRIESSGRGLEIYHWSEVEQLLIRRAARHHRDFQSLELVLPNCCITFPVRRKSGGVEPVWRGIGDEPGPEPEVVGGFFRRAVPTGKTVDTVLDGRPRTREEWMDRLHQLGMTNWQVRSLPLVFLPLVIIFLFIALALSARSAVMIGLIPFLIGGTPWYFLVLKIVRKRVREWDRLLAEGRAAGWSRETT